MLHFKIQCTSKMFLLIFFSSLHEGISLVLSTECCNVLKCSRMNAAGTMMAFSASIFFLLCRFFLLSAQLKLISASLDSTTWPFFVQLGPCMSFQSFTQMHFYCFFFERPQHHVLNAFVSLPNLFEWTRGLKFFLHKTAPNPFANVSTQLILVNL